MELQARHDALTARLIELDALVSRIITAGKQAEIEAIEVRAQLALLEELIGG